eukprot:TRINITY_DN5028_c0_g1_i2.p1 TRINITY_DN5028_c0_g1~~TRINITY_DN5028_c0_g1_i2.p1  ORF type:complete len:177 (-),score=22.67 TRINITY_DN5028_c0_g1_i2:23-553(-)
MASFTWTFGGYKIFLVGSWDSWRSAHLLKNNEVKHLNLKPGLYEYKFRVDGVWTLNPDEPKISCQQGILNRLFRNNLQIKNNIIRVLPPGSPCVVVCLGEKLENDGNASQILIGRVEKAVEAAIRNNAVGIIFTGGKVSSLEHCSEAEVMKLYALQKGYPESQIILEDQALSLIHI